LPETRLSRDRGVNSHIGSCFLRGCKPLSVFEARRLCHRHPQATTVRYRRRLFIERLTPGFHSPAPALA
jgi:hypothetical protein